MNSHDSSRHTLQSVDTLQAIAVQSLARWGIICRDIRLLKHRENAVFKIVSDNGNTYALRVHRDSYHSDAELHSELQWMHALQSAGVDVPIVVPALDGSLFVHAAPEEGARTLQVDLFEWIDGAQLGTSEGGLGHDVQNIEHIYRTIGGIAARLHNQSSQWAPPTGFTRHAWDRDGLVGPNPFWGRFWELEALTPAQRSLMIRAREIVDTELSEMERAPDHQDNFGLIHADFVPENLLVDQGVVRLLDFDDAGYGWHLFELATALHFIRGDQNYLIARTALIDGYRAQRALPDSALEKLPLFQMARGFTYVGWMHTRQGMDMVREMTPVVTGLACSFAEEFVDTWGKGAGPL